MIEITPPTRVLLLSMPDQFLGFWIAARLPNLGLVSMAGNQDPTECEIGVVDLVLCRDHVLTHLKRILDNFQPEFVGLNCMTFQYFTARKLAQWIKEEYNPNIKILMGGYHPSLCYDDIMLDKFPSAKSSNNPENHACPWCDFIIRGEGEISLRSFIHAYREKLPYDTVPSLSWRSADGKVHHNPRSDVCDLTQIKLPDRSARLVNSGYHIIGRQGDVVETSRGCTHMCKFCSITQMYGRGIRYYDLDRVIQDIKACQDRGSKSILFIDDNITLNPLRFEQLCDRIIAEGLNDIDFQTQASAAGLLARDTLIPKMGKAGFTVVFYGIENIKRENLKFFQKSIPLERLKTLTKTIHQNGMISFGGFILGNPDDQLRDFDLNVRFARTIDLDFPAFQILTPFPRTEIRTELEQAGLLTNPYDYSRYTGIFSNIKTPTLSPEVMEKEVLRSYYRYYNPRWFFSRLGRIGIMRKYWRYIALVVKKYAPIAINSWKRTNMPAKSKDATTEAENGILDQFTTIRDQKRQINFN